MRAEGRILVQEDQISGESVPPTGSPERSGGLPAKEALRDSEVLIRAQRRRFTAEYKADLVRRADACLKPGEVGALLRREGLYFSQLLTWRKKLREHGIAGLNNKRGPAPKAKPSAREIELERKNRKLEKQLAKSQLIIEFQKHCTSSWGSR